MTVRSDIIRNITLVLPSNDDSMVLDLELDNINIGLLFMSSSLDTNTNTLSEKTQNPIETW